MNTASTLPRFSSPLEADQRAAAEDIARSSGQSLTAVVKLALGLGLPQAREVMCPALAPLTDAERRACMAQMDAEEIELDCRLSEASLAAQQGMRP